MVGIYKITNPSGKIYIGQSIDIKKRFGHYKRLACKKQTIMYASLKKYGYNEHKFEILCECSADDLNQIERYYQDFFEVLGGNGMNCRLTQLHDKKGEISVESRRRMSESQKGKTIPKAVRDKISETSKGRFKSEETKAKMRKPKSEEHRVKIKEAVQNMSEETKAKIGKAHRGKKISEEQKETLRILNTGNKYSLGRVMSEETKNKLRVCNLGKKQSEETLKKKYESSLDSNEKKKKLILNLETGIYYLGAKEVSLVLNCSYESIRRKLSGEKLNKTSFMYV